MTDADWVYVTVTSQDHTALQQNEVEIPGGALHPIGSNPRAFFNAGPAGFTNILRQPLKFYNQRTQVALYSLTYTLRMDAPTATFFVNTDLIVANQQIGNELTNALARVTLQNPGFVYSYADEKRDQQNLSATNANPEGMSVMQSRTVEATYTPTNLQWKDVADSEITSITTTITDDGSLTGQPSDKFQKGYTDSAGIELTAFELKDDGTGNQPFAPTQVVKVDKRTAFYAPATQQGYSWQYRAMGSGPNTTLPPYTLLQENSANQRPSNTVVTYVFRTIQ